MREDRRSTDETTELETLRFRLAELERENSALRARQHLDDQLESDAERYGLIFENIGEGVVLQTATGEIRASNPAAQRVLGLTADQMAGRTSLDSRWRAMHEDGSPYPGETHPAMVALRTGERVKDAVMGVHKPDGHLTWIRINAQPLFRPGQESPYAVVTSFVEITDYKRSRDQLARSEERLRFALESARMGTWEWDIQTGKVDWSDDVERIFGLPAGTFDHTYEGFLALVHPEDRGAVESLVQRTFSGASGSDDYHVEHRVQRPDASVAWVEGFGHVYRDEMGEPQRMAGTVTEITTRKSLETQLESAQRMETVGRLAGGIAHDFNNLLTAILGCVEIARTEEGVPPPVASALDSIQDASERAAGLTAQLLTFARKRVFNIQSVDLGILTQSMDRLLSRLIGEDVLLTLEHAPTPIVVKADPAQIEQLLLNLAVNARDAMPKGGSLQVRLDVVEFETGQDPTLLAGRYARLRVQDTGTGIDPAALPHIFDPFYSTKEEGSGLGLATCYGIVQQLGGAIRAESEPRVGSCFCVLLPIAEASAGTAKGALRAPSAPRQGRILLVEDDQMVRLVTEKGLRAHGYEVLVAEDGQAALKMTDELNGIDLLISDVVMPGMNGFELASYLRNQRADLKVLFVSGYSDHIADDGRECDRETASAYLKKPYSISELARRAAQLIDGKATPPGTGQPG